MWQEIGKDLLYGLVAVVLSLPGLYLIVRIIYGAEYGKVSHYFRSRTSTVASLLTLACCLLWSVSVSFALHYVSDYGLTSTGKTIGEVLQNPNELLDPPLELNVCDEWYPNCAYED